MLAEGGDWKRETEREKEEREKEREIKEIKMRHKDEKRITETCPTYHHYYNRCNIPTVKSMGGI